MLSGSFKQTSVGSSNEKHIILSLEKPNRRTLGWTVEVNISQPGVRTPQRLQNDSQEREEDEKHCCCIKLCCFFFSNVCFSSKILEDLTFSVIKSQPENQIVSS